MAHCSAHEVLLVWKNHMQMFADTSFIRRSYILAVILLSLFMAGCGEASTELRGGIGLIRPVVSIDPSVTLVSGEVMHDMIVHVPDVNDLSLTVASADGEYGHTWSSISEYDTDTPYEPGEYTVAVSYDSRDSEGFDSPRFMAETSLVVAAGQTVEPQLECKLISTLFRVEYTDAFRTRFSDFGAIIHSAGGAYLEYPATESRPIYLQAGELTFEMYMTLPSGERVRFEAATVADALPAHLYYVTIDASERASDGVTVINLSFDQRIVTDDINIALTPEFINSAAPAISPVGFTPGVPLSVTEGVEYEGDLAVAVSGSDISRLILTTASAYLQRAGWPAEMDMLHMSDDESAIMERMGMSVTQTADDNVRVDFSELPARLRLVSGQSEETAFTFVAVSRNRKISDPLNASIKVNSASVALKSASDVVVGVDVAELTVHSVVPINDNITVFTTDLTGKKWTESAIESIAPAGEPNEYTVRYRVPEGNAPFIVRIDYCGSEIGRTVRQRVSPKYTISINAFALRAIVTVHAADPELTALITSMLHVYADGVRVQAINRDEANGRVTVTGLEPARRYSFKASVFEFPASEADYCEPVYEYTEYCYSLTNGGFDDVKDGIKYTGLPSGGVYSQSIVPIYNGQNRTDYRLQEPKGWANTNSKTFCTASSVHNTWYMQPSAYTSEDAYYGYSLKVQSVAWDAHGSEIKPYLQESQPYVPYSRIIPDIAHRAAGKAFLGSYTFQSPSGQEVYDEGIPFAARPSALNGFYKYLPCTLLPSDRGLIRVELIGKIDGIDIVIAQGECKLIPVTSFTAFSVPLEYNHDDIKATRLCVMVASTDRIGSIEYETAHVVTAANMRTATSTGSELWVDELTLSY
ncbi:MAG: DUF4493 domain-containing protein [Muribaculaceae bacterium]|nr:DUF4493 domain-containing protein [Muribaculaceae bacterium]